MIGTCGLAFPARSAFPAACATGPFAAFACRREMRCCRAVGRSFESSEARRQLLLGCAGLVVCRPFSLGSSG